MGILRLTWAFLRVMFASQAALGLLVLAVLGEDHPPVREQERTGVSAVVGGGSQIAADHRSGENNPGSRIGV